MTVTNDVVVLLDVDNPLLGNDRVQDELRNHLERECGAASRARYWVILDALRAELGYADDLGALQRYPLGALNDPRLLQISSFLVDCGLSAMLGAIKTGIHVRSNHEADQTTA